MKFFKSKGNYIRIDNSDLSNKIDMLKSEFEKTKQPKFNRRKNIKNICKFSFWLLFFGIILLLIKTYFFNNKIDKENKPIINNGIKTKNNKNDSINLNKALKKQKAYNTTENVENSTSNKKNLKINENKKIINKNEKISFTRKKTNKLN